jgi:hypothetical protein
MAPGQESTITRGFLFADLRGYTDFVEGLSAAQQAAERFTAEVLRLVKGSADDANTDNTIAGRISRCLGKLRKRLAP